MKFTKVLSALAVCACSMSVLSSCQKKEEITTKAQLSQETLSQIRQLGFTTTNAQKVDGGYLVEGDILLSESDLNSTPDHQLLRVGNAEQYRTNNLVSVGSGRTVSVSMSSTLPSSYVAALDEAIRRYNAENLLIRFVRVSSGANIAMTKSPSNASYLASSGFPTGGNPYNSVVINSTYLGSNPGTNYLGTILAHELGHCIGFRHTDYMDRSYSCGGAYANEGASTVGAVYIPGTSSSAEPSSWMLACVAGGQNRPFDSYDRTALNYLY